MNLLARDLWQEVQDAFRAECGVPAAELWLPQVRPLDFSRGLFTLGAANEVVREWLDHQYRERLETVIQKLTGSPVRVLLKVAPAPVARLAPPADPSPEPSPERVPPCDARCPVAEFVVRPENKYAYSALHRQLQGVPLGNPLFLHGPPGAGKSALLRHHLERLREESGPSEPPRAVLLLAAETFSQGLVAALKEGRMAEFRGRMLAADALVVDEAHRLRGKTRTQREFLSILRYHLERSRPVVIASRHPPNAIFMLDEALRSYFLSGALVRLADPGPASRVAVLERVAARFRRPVPAETLERIVQRVPGGLDRQVRFLEKVAAYAALENRGATPAALAEAFPEFNGSGDSALDLAQVVARVAVEFGTTPEAIASSSKVRAAVLGRHVAVYIATVAFNMKARRVTRQLGGLSPSTTAYARRRVEAMRRDDPLFDARVRRLLDELHAGQRMLF